MSKLVTLLGRKAAPAQPATATPEPAKPAPEKTEIELDQELFFPAASQVGQENEALRNLLIDAGYKIDELESIKTLIAKLIDPVAKTLRAYEETKHENLNLQKVLNSTRVAHNKLREDLATTDAKARTLDSECQRLREVVAIAQQTAAAHEKARAEHLAELTARRSHVAELQRHLQAQGVEMQQTREENRQLIERVTASDRRSVQIEAQAQAATQTAMQSAQECSAMQAALDKAHSDMALTQRRLTETEKALGVVHARLKSLEPALAEAQTERARLSEALDEANQRHTEELNTQNSRFEALQARAASTENILEEARQNLMTRAEEIRAFERRIIESSTAHDTSGERIAQLTATLAERDTQIRELETAYDSIYEHSETLSNSVTAHDSAYSNATEKIKEQADQIKLLEAQISTMKMANETQLEQVNAQLQREQLERAMAEGALESGRKDVARLLGEIAAMQHRQSGMKSAA
jgi:crescentin